MSDAGIDLARATRPREHEGRLLAQLNELTEHHRARCAPYARLLATLGPPAAPADRLAALPYLPVGLFKSHRLLSVPDDEVFKVLTSSGTTGQATSRIHLDRETAQRQSAALATTMAGLLGPRRLPMLIVDSERILRDRQSFSARAAGVVGMMGLGRDHRFALDDEMGLDVPGVRAFLAAHGHAPFLVFGFTFMVWRHFYQAIAGQDVGLDLRHGTLIHSGGWKKLEELKVDNEAFKRRLNEACGLARVHNFYGMVEQIGGVFLEGTDGALYPPPFADVIIRDPRTWKEAPEGAVGVIQVLSVLPRSYPGHSLLTEDLGVVNGWGPAPGGGIAKRLTVLGRAARAELRGCSDTHAYGSAIS